MDGRTGFPSVFGTLFGAVYITLLTSLISNWRIFDPLVALGLWR